MTTARLDFPPLDIDLLDVSAAADSSSGIVYVTLRHGDRQATDNFKLDIEQLPPLDDSPERYGAILLRRLILDHQGLQGAFRTWLVRSQETTQIARVRLAINSRRPALHNLAWETLTIPAEYNNGRRLTLARDASYCFTRRQINGDVPESAPPTDRPRALLCIANPSDGVQWGFAPIDVAEQRRHIHSSLAWATIDDLLPDGPRRPTLVELQTALLENYDIVCITCHGTLSSTKGPALFLETAAGKADPVDRHSLAQLFGSGRRPRLLILHACQTANSEATHASLASTLADLGIPAVIAFKEQISVLAAGTFLSTLFRRIFEGRQSSAQVLMAAVAGRLLLRDNSWWQPVVFIQREVPLLDTDGALVKRAKALLSRIENAPAQRSEIIRLLQDAGLRPCDESFFVLACCASRLDSVWQQTLDDLLHGRTPARLAETGGAEQTLPRKLTSFALKLARLLASTVPGDALLRTLYQVCLWYRKLPPAPVPGMNAVQMTLITLASDFSHEPDRKNHLIDSPLLTAADWLSKRHPEHAGSISAWKEDLLKAVGWTSVEPLDHPVPRYEPEPVLYLTIKLTPLHHAETQSAENGEWTRGANAGQRVTAAAWLWCSELLQDLQLPCGAAESYTLDRVGLSDLCAQLIGPIEHLLDSYAGGLVVEWIVPWFWLDWPFAHEVRIIDGLIDPPLSNRFTFVVRWATERQSRYGKLPEHKRRFKRGSPEQEGERDRAIESHELRAYPTSSAIPSVTREGDVASPQPLGVMVTTPIEATTAEQFKKALRALLGSQAPILAWLRGGQPQPKLADLIEGCRPARPPSTPPDMVLLWEDLERVPPLTAAKQPGSD